MQGLISTGAAGYGLQPAADTETIQGAINLNKESAMPEQSSMIIWDKY